MTEGEGTVISIRVDKGFGFIAMPNSPDTFFHVSDLVDLAFDETLKERCAMFDVTTTPKGPRAVNVRPAS